MLISVVPAQNFFRLIYNSAHMIGFYSNGFDRAKSVTEVTF